VPICYADPAVSQNWHILASTRVLLGRTQCHTCLRRGHEALAVLCTHQFLPHPPLRVTGRVRASKKSAEYTAGAGARPTDCKLLLRPQMQSYWQQQQKHAALQGKNAWLTAHMFTPTQHANKQCRTSKIGNCAAANRQTCQPPYGPSRAACAYSHHAHTSADVHAATRGSACGHLCSAAHF